ncbi:MAG: heat-inducible transcriptional repressor HrcA [Alphaproteobacteria bacterium]|nr:heat-inducible transcriptional repressor HrcA [Alphaproteobacteria bacterium]
MSKEFTRNQALSAQSAPGIAALNERARDVLRMIVESYLETGEPVGSRTIAQKGPLQLSPASIRNVMSDLEQLGLLSAPHTSAGRMPTHAGLRLFVDAMLEVGNLSDDERQAIEGRIAAHQAGYDDVLRQATAMLAGLSQCAGLVVAPKADRALKHVEFVSVAPDKALVVMVGDDGSVENRLIVLPLGLPASALTEASNYLNARVRGRTLEEARGYILAEIVSRRAELDLLTARLVEAGVAAWSGDEGLQARSLIVRGASRLLSDLTAGEDLERIRMLFDDIEQKEELVRLLDFVQEGEGVRIFIGAENKLMSLSGSSVVLAPYVNGRSKVVGVVGVIGPTRLNYARIIPMVDYTAKVIGRLLS